MSKNLEGRIENLEAGGKAPVCLVFSYEGQPELAPEEIDRLVAEAMRKNPGQEIYFLYPPEVRNKGENNV
ncbi:MAG: hypothetical protein HY673_16720 [Chloroflexi bacterium]|nr:hypothetical protein [Chloroflexota bacterium]